MIRESDSPDIRKTAMTSQTTGQSSPSSAPAPRGSALDDRFDLTDGEVYLSGIQALTRLPLDIHRLDHRRGLDTGVFISGYEGSPLAGLDLQLARQRTRLDAHNVVFTPAVNEELGATAVQGSQLASASADRVVDGVVGIWYGKAPGLDRATDAIRHSNLAGTHTTGGVLALVGDDSIAKSSTVPSSSEVAIAELGMPCLSPADPQDILDLGLQGVAMSRASGLWVALKLATNVVDGSATVRLDAQRVTPIDPDRTFDGTPFHHEVTGHLLQPVLGRLEASQVRERIELARRYAAANHLDRIVGDRSATLGIVCAGATYRDTRQALHDMGINDDTIAASGVRILKLGMISPLEPGIIDEFADGLTEVVVVEEKKPFIELALKDLLYGRAGAPAIHGKRDASGGELFRADSDLPADYIAARLAPKIIAHGGDECVTHWLAAREAKRPMPTLLPILPRTPYFCSGCPHNSSTRVPDGALVGGGIGCHGLVTIMPTERVGETIGLSAMGGEGASWVGMSPFVSRGHLIQNLGDGTYHHSGSLAVRNAIAAGTNITYKLLYNDTVAMTGGQDAVGKMTVPKIVAELLAEGVAEIVITSDDPKASRRAFGARRLPPKLTIRHRDDLIEVQEQLAAIAGVTVLIHEQACATELRRKRKRGLVEVPTKRILINERVCEGCGDCGDQSNCLSVQPVDTEFGRKTRIDQSTCNLDFSCIKGDCPSFLEVTPGTRRAPTQTPTLPDDGSALPDPELLVPTDDFAMRITGVGGTGVVTVAQVLTAAASRAGLQVAGLDQLGLAQKGGAVVSDIRFSTSPIVGGNKIGPGGCDLFLGCDILVAAAEPNLTVIAPDRTYAVVSTSTTPTGAMVTDTHVQFPDMGTLIDRIEWARARPENVFVDVRKELAAHGGEQYANVFLLGVAVQAGVLPLAPDHIEWALELNGVQVAGNQQAFRLGRRYALDRESGTIAADSEAVEPVVSEIAERVECAAGSELSTIVTRSVTELIAYQNAAYARQYADDVERVRAIEADRLDETAKITETFAQQLFKVMAYKDEYEVARLHLDPAFTAQIKAEFGDDATYSFLLHPPMLRGLGLDRKIRLRGWWGRIALFLLYVLRPTRGTRLDLFGYTRIRRAERRLIDDYRDVMHAALSALGDDNSAKVAELAGLPDWIRGYEDIKLRSLETYYQRTDQLLKELTEEDDNASAGAHPS